MLSSTAWPPPPSSPLAPAWERPAPNHGQRRQLPGAASNNIVQFGGVRATVLSASSTNLTAACIGATYAPITVTVGGLTAYGASPFLPTFPGGTPLDNSSLSSRLDLNAGSGPIRIVIATDGDGKPDLAIGNASSGTVSIYRNISTNGSLICRLLCASRGLAAAAHQRDQSLQHRCGGLDGDGKLDIVAINADSDVVSILRNVSTPGTITTNSFAARIDISAGSVMRGLAVQDLDGDGRRKL